jgi:hypothetical protein
MAPLKFGLVGTGHWAQVAHAPALASTDGIELAAVWGRNRASAEQLAMVHNAAAHSDIDSFLAEVDAVAFAVPPDVQAPIAERAANAGKHLLLEKPVALDDSAADALVAAVDRAGVASVVFFTARFQPDVRDWLADVALPDVALPDVAMPDVAMPDVALPDVALPDVAPAGVAPAGVAGRTGWMSGTAVLLGLNLELGLFNTPWRREKGALWDVAPHVISLLWASLGPVTSVTADAGLADITHLVLHHQGGVTSTATMTLSAPEPAAGFDLYLWGESGKSALPTTSGDAVAAMRTALTELAANARSGQVSHPCDVRFGRDIGRVLADAQRQLDSRARRTLR